MRSRFVWIAEGEDAMEKPAVKLFTWKKAALIITLCVGAVFDRAGHTYHQKGHLNSVDLWASAMTIVTTLCVVAIVGWWANREE